MSPKWIDRFEHAKESIKIAENKIIEVEYIINERIN